MLQTSQYKQVLQFRMGHPVQGQVLYWCAAYLVHGLLIDTGCAHTAAELLTALRPAPPRLVVNTHYHEDHIGANALLASELGLELLAPAASLPRLAQGYSLPPYRQMVWGLPQPSQAKALGPEVVCQGQRFQVIDTPGHTEDHVVFWLDQAGWAFSGDLFISTQPRPCRREDRPAQTLESLKRLAGLEPGVLFTGLGQIVEPAGPALAQAIEALEEVKLRVADLGRQGLEPEQMVTAIFGRESHLTEQTDGYISYLNLIRSFQEP